ncbi:MAG TPA: pyrroline-5-carboxylate reductase [Dictyoglomaceae bacterium]|nr:pyrroline-5-carboxylate reductase [Dictyoglomaceae bacterium]HOL38901.1 pyrroline-5-carboxylate reductase [Dictyoglomaceae bacterium]HPP15682.1 pyrroline-5-carboxylate reductase [Dictyoglomaceae bacterium]HPU43398.1 pyrroline-5-carboxylate reductase [Dictyoglomaceae bacterium]
MELGIIGGGMMGEAILSGVLESNFLPPQEILVSEPVESREKYLKDKYNISIVDNILLIKNSEFILIAVKPQNIKGVLEEIKPHIRKGQAFISIAAGVPLNYLEKYLYNVKSLFRVMPNLPCTVKKGAIAITYNKAEKEDLRFVKELFSNIGKVWEMDEKNFDIITALTGSGPAFVSLILQSFVLSGVNGGISYNTAKEMVLQLFDGTIEYIRSKDLSFEDIIKMTSSPAGTTIAGLEKLYKEGISGIIMEAISSAKEKGEEISKKL